MNEPLWSIGALFAGKYRIEAVLGRGGMGVVLGARHERLDEPVAIKVLLPAMMDTPGVIDRFLREARAATKIKSQHVVRVTDVDVLPSGLPFIVMERLDGMDLAALCQQKREIEIEEAVRYVVEACDAVAEAHARGIVHRDLKPGNLFLAEKADGSSTIKVLDFGISKVAAEDGEHAVTDAGATLGSPSYMSPEQMRSARDVDARTDIWALGAVLFRLLTGRAPFRADTVPQLYALVSSATLQRPSELRADIPPELDDVLVRCLEKEPARRFATATELAAALLPFAGEGARVPALPSSTRAPGLDEQRAGAPPAEKDARFEASDSAHLMPSAPMETAAAQTVFAKRAQTNGRWVRAAAAVAVIALIAAGAHLRAAHRGEAVETAPAAPSAAGAIAAAMPDVATTAPSPAIDAGEPIVVPAASVASSASPPPRPPQRPPRGERVEKKSSPPPRVPSLDPFGGGRK